MKRLLVCVVVVSAGCKGAADKAISKSIENMEVTGSVDLSPQAGTNTASGKLALREVNKKDLEVTGTLSGLTAGSKYVVHYHTEAGCPPPTDKHDDASHKSDLVTVTSDANGTATVKATIANARLSGMEPVSNYCISVHAADGGAYLSSGRILPSSLGLGGGN